LNEIGWFTHVALQVLPIGYRAIVGWFPLGKQVER
jgi:hypothetical protein